MRFARVERIAGTYEWRAPDGGGMTPSYVNEVTEASDNSPTLAQPAILTNRVQAFIPISAIICEELAWPGD